MKGKVKRFSDYHGYGFIAGNDGQDYFVYYTSIIGEGYRTLSQGDIVIFEPFETSKGLLAHDVEVANDKSIEIGTPLSIKKNPFTPQDPVTDPDKFAGRKEPFQNAVDALYNNKNILITGERGIGKSSVAYQLLYLTNGEKALLDKLNIDLGDYEFSYMTGDFRCMTEHSINDIVKGLINSLKRFAELSEKKQGRTASFDLNLKFIKYTSQTSYEDLTPSDLTDLFTSEVESIFRELDEYYTGICFLIDEIDTIDPKIDIASFLKAVVEKFRADGFASICFIVSGVTGTITKMISQHPSASRLFEVLELKPMQDEEMVEIINSALVNTDVAITHDATTRIINLSNCFPQPVQLLGYHSFKYDTNNEINLIDVNHARDFIVQNIRKQEFDNRIQVIGSGVIKDILKVMAQAKEDAVDLSYISERIASSSLDQITGNMSYLLEKSYVVNIGKTKYKFREPLFKTYLRWTFDLV